MKISYFLYSFLVSLWIFSDAPLYNRSRWWALGTFIFPVLTPIYFVKTKPLNKYWKYIGLWLLGFVVFFTVESTFLKKEQFKSTSEISSVSSELKRQILNLSNKSALSVRNFQKDLNSLDEIKDLDTIPKLNQAISTVERVQLLFCQANQDSDYLSDFISQNKMRLQKEGLDVYLDMEGLIGETYFGYRKALREYLNSYKAMLEYSRDNFEAIVQGQNPQSDIYNQLFLKYSNALDLHNEAYLHHMKFVDQFSSRHPDLVEYITKSQLKMREIK